MVQAKKDENGIPVLMGVSNVDGVTPVMVYVDPVTHRLLVDIAGGSGTVTSVSIVTANGISGSVATSTTTPAITLTLGAITPTTVNGHTFTAGSSTFTGTAGQTYTFPAATSTLMANPMTTGGDIIYGGASGVPTRLANGTAGYVLQSNGTTLAPSWVAAGTGDVVKVGTPVNNQVGVWTGDGTLEGDAALTFDTTTDVLSSGGLLLSGLTASEIVITDASKNLASAPVATYPSLTELTYVKGVTSAIQTQLGNKAPTTSPTFATSITGSYLTASEMLITDGSKNIVSAPVATYPSLTELAYVKGVTSAIQTQLSAMLPLAGGTITGNIQLGENTSIALDPAGSADGKYSGITISGTAGATLAFGDVIVLDVTASKWLLADANSAAAADGDARGLIGMCVLAAADTEATTILLNGTCRADANFPALTITAPVYLSETAGDIVVAQPTTTDVVIRTLGFALTADEIYFNPSADYITHV